jgi:hypothetical protein
LKHASAHRRIVLWLTFYIGFDTGAEARALFEQWLDHLAEGDAERRSLLLDEVAATQRRIERQMAKCHFSRAVMISALDSFTGYGDRVHGIVDAAMDVYLVARPFSTFDAAKMGRGPLGCLGAMFRNVRNAIVYSGQAHTTFYEHFLQTVFPGLRAERVEFTGRQCIELKEPFDFFAGAGPRTKDWDALETVFGRMWPLFRKKLLSQTSKDNALALVQKAQRFGMPSKEFKTWEDAKRPRELRTNVRNVLSRGTEVWFEPVLQDGALVPRASHKRLPRNDTPLVREVGCKMQKLRFACLDHTSPSDDRKVTEKRKLRNVRVKKNPADVHSRSRCRGRGGGGGDAPATAE